MPYLLDVPAKHRWVSLKPFIGEIDIASYLETGKIETVLSRSGSNLRTKSGDERSNAGKKKELYR